MSNVKRETFSPAGTGYESDGHSPLADRYIIKTTFALYPKIFLTSQTH